MRPFSALEWNALHAVHLADHCPSVLPYLGLPPGWRFLIAPGYEDVWQRLRARYGKNAMPRTVNTITGPSRTGDIEQTIELGAHGPRRMHILVVHE